MTDQPAPRRSSLSREALISWMSNTGGSALSLVSVLVVSRALGPSGRGQVAFLTTVANMTAQIAAFGVHRAAANLGQRDPERAGRIHGTTVALGVVLGVIAIVVLSVLMALVPAIGGHEPAALRWLALASVPAVIVQVSLNQIGRAHYLFSVTNLGWVLPPLVNATVNGILALTGALTVGTAVAAWVAGQVLMLILFAAYFAIRRVVPFGRPDPGLVRRILRFGVRTHAGQVMFLGNYRLDQWILGAISTDRQLGLYSVAVAWSETLFFLPTAVQSVLRPDLIRAEPEEAREQASLALRVCQLITAVVGAAMIALAPVLCIDIFGKEFADSVGQLRVLVLGAFGIAALKILGDALTSQRRPMLETSAIGVAFAGIVVLDAVLIPSHGGMGAAIGSAIAYTLGGVAVGIIFLRTLGGGWRDLLPGWGEVGFIVRRLPRRRVRR